MGIVLFILGVLLSGDAVAVIFKFGIELGALITLAIGILVILWAVNYKKIKQWRGFLWFLKLLFKAGLIYIAVISIFLGIFGCVNTADYNENYAIVLGCGIKNSRPSLELKGRLDRAAEYAEENPDAQIIVTGGQGRGENTAEANVMYSYLVDKGVSADRLIKEDQSHNTYENFKLSDELTGNRLDDADVAVITSGYHMFRAKLYARIYGIDAKTVPSGTSIYLIPVSYVREALAFIKMAVYYLPSHSG